VLAEVLNLAWMSWLVALAWRMRDLAARRLADDRAATPAKSNILRSSD
jgi:hypothetical protein